MLRTLALLCVLLSGAGCAEPLSLLARAPTAGVSPCFFWPPPPSTATWLAKPGIEQRLPMNSVASGLERSLREAGYSEQRWYPIGTSHEHGFAVTTRLERVDGGERSDPPERWTSLHREAANLKWLTLARTIPFPRPGQYGVMLIAYTDLPIGPTSIASIWSDETIMDGPGARESFSARESGVPARLPIDYQFGIYEYQYESDGVEARGALRPADRSASGEMPRPSARLVRVLGSTVADWRTKANF